MDNTPEPAGPRSWTPGAGWERLKREMPHLVPDLTEDDLRKADEIIAAADRHDRQQRRAA
jgi:hypothetical protein